MEESSKQEASASHHCVVPDWNHRGQALAHVQFQPNLTAASNTPFHFLQRMHVPVEVMHEANLNCAHDVLPLIPAAPPLKPRWGSSDTLESIVRQATRREVDPPKPQDDGRNRPRSCTESHRKATRVLGPIPPSQAAPRKRSCMSEQVLGRKNVSLSSGTCGSGSSTFNMREDDSNAMTTTKLIGENDTSQDESGSKGEEGEGRGAKGHAPRCSKQSKGATTTTTTHNLSERRRRDRINEKMKALQKMVPNSSKTDKVSMLDEVIVYMKQLQAQVEMMNLVQSNAAATDGNINVNLNIPQMMNAMMAMPPAALSPQQQQQLQMSLLARMGVGLGLGMLEHANSSASNNTFIAPSVPQPHLPPHFLMPQMIPAAAFTASHLNPNVRGPLGSMPLPDPYAAFMAQKLSMDNYYNKLAAIHQQQTRRHSIHSEKKQRK
ncbi:hypothetical protein MLD38_021816 [Melastoma candidum]|uniref:Uncharacterized protein n=1 Tax=Melastoma candidum TaxID=119954 RepID=A0ACB9QKN4_9MYRT|nr:hypothetical protein MLD38_021816 [Melastoma candidum]